MQYYLSIVIRESFFTIISRFFVLAKLSALKVIKEGVQTKGKSCREPYIVAFFSGFDGIQDTGFFPRRWSAAKPP